MLWHISWICQRSLESILYMYLNSPLKRAIGQATMHRQLPQVTAQGTFDLSPFRSLDQRNLVKDQRVVHQLLVQWRGCSIHEATWEDEDLLQLNFPEFFPEDMLKFKGEGMSRTGVMLMT